jgi:hypothetical protein
VVVRFIASTEVEVGHSVVVLMTHISLILEADALAGLTVIVLALVLFCVDVGDAGPDVDCPGVITLGLSAGVLLQTLSCWPIVK